MKIHILPLGGQYTGSELDVEHDAATANMGAIGVCRNSAETLELLNIIILVRMVIQ